MPGVMSDSTMMGSDPFGDLHEFFSQGGQNFFNHFNPALNDSSLVMPGDSMSGMNGFEQLRAEMMNHFRQFFQSPGDSTQLQLKGGPNPGDSFFDQKGFDQMRKEFEKHFKQFVPKNNGHTQKMKGSSINDENNPKVKI